MPPRTYNNADFRLLVLGGTAGARQLTTRLQAIRPVKVTLSLAGRTRSPTLPAAPVRTGGFGGSSGLARYLRNNHINALVVATHPFAARIATHAVSAARATQTPLIRLLSPAWQPQPEDNWCSASCMEAVPALLGSTPQRVLLTIGRQQLAPFEQAPQHHYLIRSVEDLPNPLALPDAYHLKARGPFTLDNELALMQKACIDVLVTKNSGSAEVAAKLKAARLLGIKVIMVERPITPDMLEVAAPKAVIHWVNEQLQRHQ